MYLIINLVISLKNLFFINFVIMLHCQEQKKHCILSAMIMFLDTKMLIIISMEGKIK